MKVTVLAESSFIFSPWSVSYADNYRHKSGRCPTFSFFLTFLSFFFPDTYFWNEKVHKSSIRFLKFFQKRNIINVSNFNQHHYCCYQFYSFKHYLLPFFSSLLTLSLMPLIHITLGHLCPLFLSGVTDYIFCKGSFSSAWGPISLLLW